MDHVFFREFSREEIESGLAYGKNKYAIALDADTLRIVANVTGRIRISERCSFEEARTRALKAHLLQRDRDEGIRFRAYVCAVSKIFNTRRVHRQKQEALMRKTAKPAAKLPTKSSKAATKPPFPTGIKRHGKKKGQLEWLF